jgi:hypothetical protein
VTIMTTDNAAARRDREEQEALGAIMAQMGVVHAAMLVLHAELGGLKMLTGALDAIIANVDELGKLYEAPALTRQALDADSAVAALIDDMAGAALRHSSTALGLHRPGLLDLAAVAQVQEEKALTRTPW